MRLQTETVSGETQTPSRDARRRPGAGPGGLGELGVRSGGPAPATGRFRPHSGSTPVSSVPLRRALSQCVLTAVCPSIQLRGGFQMRKDSVSLSVSVT